MTAILGISAYYHDAAAALVVDGEVVAAAQEERFSRKKHDEGFPKQAVEYCLREAGLDAGDLDYVGFYDKPYLKFERLLESYLGVAPRGVGQFYAAMPEWLGKKLHLTRRMGRALGGEYRKKFVFCEHHESHAASAFYPSPFAEAAILTMDGVGEWATTSFGVGSGEGVELSYEQHFPHSLGLLYAAFTAYCGFRVNSGEYKVMGLAPYGEPRFVDQILNHLIDLKGDGSFRLDLSYFSFLHGFTMTSEKFHCLFGSGPRVPESEMSQFYKDIAASIQKVTEEIVLRSVRWLHEKTGQRNLCLAGGVALNCVANGRIVREGPFENVWVQPASNDSGGALGVAWLIWHRLLGNERVVSGGDLQKGSLLGPAFEARECGEILKKAGAKFEVIEDVGKRADWIAREIAEGRVVGLMQGRMEFGPRALGSRSILGDARKAEMQSVINQKVKFRESFRPFAPAVLKERVGECFEFSVGFESPLYADGDDGQERCSPGGDSCGWIGEGADGGCQTESVFLSSDFGF